MAHFRLGEILIKQGLITEAQLEQAISVQKTEKGRIGEVLIKLGMIKEEDMVKALGTQLILPYSIHNPELLVPKSNQGLEKLISQDFAKKNMVIPLSKHMGSLTV